jgi:hypothetical protein
MPNYFTYQFILQNEETLTQILMMLRNNDKYLYYNRVSKSAIEVNETDMEEWDEIFADAGLEVATKTFNF